MIGIEQFQIDARNVFSDSFPGKPSSMQELPGAGHGQAGVAHPSEGFELVGQRLNLLGLAPHNDDFETVVVVHMDVGGGDYMVVVVVLHQGNFFLQFMLVVVVNQADDAHDLFVRLPFIFDEVLADQITNCLRPICVAAGHDMFIKYSQ